MINTTCNDISGIANIWARRCPVKKNSLRTLLIVIAGCSRDGRRCSPSQRWLAQQTKQDVRTVRRQMKRLVEAGFIEIRPRTDEYGGRKSSLITLRIDDIQRARAAREAVAWDQARPGL